MTAQLLECLAMSLEHEPLLEDRCSLWRSAREDSRSHGPTPCGQDWSRSCFCLESRPLTTSARTLPIRITPRAEESFAGFTDRLAAQLGVPLITLLNRTGVVAEERFSALPVGYGIALTPERLQTFARVTRLPEDVVSAMLLTRYDGVCCDLSPLDLSSTRTLTKATVGSWVYFVGSHACPNCLAASDGVWKLQWKLPWSFACMEHGTLLIDTCPGCYRKIGSGRRDGRSAPAFPSIVPNPTACRNTLSKGMASAGRSSRPCGYDFCTVQASSVAGSHVLAAQQHIDAVLAGGEATVAGETVRALDYFDDLRSLCALLLSVGETGDLGDIPEIVRPTFDLHIQHCSEIREWREKLTATGKDWRIAPRLRPYARPPESAALMATVAPRATRMLDVASTEALAEELEPFVERMHNEAGRVPQRFGYFGISSRLQKAFDLCWRSRQRLTTRLGMSQGARVEKEPSLLGLTPDYVPQLFWKEHFEQRLAEHLPDITSDHGRRVCSMWLVKAIVNCTWEEAAEGLGLPPRRSRDMVTKVVKLLNATGKADLFDARVREVAARVADDPTRTDFGARRRTLADLADIERGEWEAICREAGVNPGNRGGRSCYAATWIWCHLTGGDYRLSPWLSKKYSMSKRDCYRRFVKENLDSLKEPLVEYGVSLLAEKQLKGSNGGDGAIYKHETADADVKRCQDTPRRQGAG